MTDQKKRTCSSCFRPGVVEAWTQAAVREKTRALGELARSSQLQTVIHRLELHTHKRRGELLTAVEQLDAFARCVCAECYYARVIRGESDRAAAAIVAELPPRPAFPPPPSIREFLHGKGGASCLIEDDDCQLCEQEREREPGTYSPHYHSDDDDEQRRRLDDEHERAEQRLAETIR